MFNDVITIYRYIDNAYVREVVYNVYYDESKQANVNKSGLINSDSVTVIIPSLQECSYTAGKDLLIKGDIDFEFDNTSQKTQSESKKSLEELGKLVTINVIDNKIHGGLKHIELSCK